MVNDYSWYRARWHFYDFWTGENSLIGNSVYRERELVIAIRSLGQILHLLQDMAVPAHVRNDFSVGHWEWIPGYMPKDTTTEIKGNRFEMYVKMYSPAAGKTNVGDPYSWFHSLKYRDTGKIDLTETTLTNFWDTDTYDGGNPPLLNSNHIGLSEYTNYNFISEGAMFAEQCADDPKHYFPWPIWAVMTDINKYEYDLLPPVISGKNASGEPVFTYAFSKKTSHGETIKQFVKPSYLTKILQIKNKATPVPEFHKIYIKSFRLDDDCFRDHAAVLIPRSIDYSTALIDYFFRGEIDLVLEDSGYVIRNLSEEEMDGTFGLYYDNSDDKRTLIRTWNLRVGANGSSEPVTFDAPSDAKTPGTYLLVFKGTMGAEKDDAVVGKVVKCGGIYVKVRVNGKDCHNKRWIRAYDPDGLKFRKLDPTQTDWDASLEAESDTNGIVGPFFNISPSDYIELSSEGEVYGKGLFDGVYSRIKTKYYMDPTRNAITQSDIDQYDQFRLFARSYYWRSKYIEIPAPSNPQASVGKEIFIGFIASNIGNYIATFYLDKIIELGKNYKSGFRLVWTGEKWSLLEYYSTHYPLRFKKYSDFYRTMLYNGFSYIITPEGYATEYFGLTADSIYGPPIPQAFTMPQEWNYLHIAYIRHIRPLSDLPTEIVQMSDGSQVQAYIADFQVKTILGSINGGTAKLWVEIQPTNVGGWHGCYWCPDDFNRECSVWDTTAVNILPDTSNMWVLTDIYGRNPVGTGWQYTMQLHVFNPCEGPWEEWIIRPPLWEETFWMDDPPDDRL